MISHRQKQLWKVYAVVSDWFPADGEGCSMMRRHEEKTHERIKNVKMVQQMVVLRPSPNSFHTERGVKDPG